MVELNSLEVELTELNFLKHLIRKNRKAIAERSKTFDADSVKVVPEVKTVDNHIH